MYRLLSPANLTHPSFSLSSASYKSHTIAGICRLQGPAELMLFPIFQFSCSIRVAVRLCGWNAGEDLSAKMSLVVGVSYQQRINRDEPDGGRIIRALPVGDAAGFQFPPPRQDPLWHRCHHDSEGSHGAL